jgi:hypothetical protein
MVKSNDYRGEKVRYPDGVGCCIWKLLKSDDEDSSGICFDFPYDERDDVLKVVLGLEKDEEKVYEPDPDYEAFEAKRKDREKKWWWKLHKSVEDIGIQVVPFDWRFNTFLVTRPVSLKGDGYAGKWCKGFHFGPFVVTW